MRIRRQRWIGSIAVLSMLLKLVMAAVHMPPAVASPAASADGAVQIVICTSSGLRVISLDGDGAPIDGSPPAGLTDCTLCLLLGASQAALAPDSDALWAPGSFAGLAHPIAAPVCHPSPLRLARGHDPPLL